MLFGLPHGDPLHDFYERESRAAEYRETRERQDRFGEVVPQPTLRLPSESDLDEAFAERAIRLPTPTEL